MTDTGHVCRDCSARFGDKHDADRHEEHTGHTVATLDVSRHARDVRRTARLDAQKPRGRRERHLDGQGKPRADY
jgi:hypothetical protein